jgi:hypothetical protein
MRRGRRVRTGWNREIGGAEGDRTPDLPGIDERERDAGVAFVPAGIGKLVERKVIERPTFPELTSANVTRASRSYRLE